MKRTRERTSKLKRKEGRIALGIISVKYVGEIIFVFVPVLFSILYSFTDYNAARETEPFFSRIGDIWIGFGNYKNLFTDKIITINKRLSMEPWGYYLLSPITDNK